MHFVAGLREFLSALNDSIEKIASFSAQIQPHLPPVDTVNGILLLKSGRSGLFSLSFGTEFKNDYLIEVISSNGSVTATSSGVKVVERNGSDGSHKESTKEFPSDNGVSTEVEAFGKSIENKALDQRQTAEEALTDLLLIEKLLRSGEQQGTVFIV